MLEAIQAMWLRELGVRITIAQVEQKTLFQNQQDRNYSIAFSGWIADYSRPPHVPRDHGHRRGKQLGGVEQPGVRPADRRGLGHADNTRRLELFQKAEAIMLGEAPLIPIFYQPQVYAISPAVHGWTTNVVGFHEFNQVLIGK